jgi:hypothetical protein
MAKPNLDEPIVRHIRTSFVAFRADQTVGQALEQLRAMPPQGRIVYFYVVDEDQRLQGVVPTRLMLLSPLEAKLGDIMIRRVVTVPQTATVMQACERPAIGPLAAVVTRRIHANRCARAVNVRGGNRLSCPPGLARR